MQEATNLISTMGFPIAMCLMCCWYIYQQGKTHKEEIDKLSAAVHEQTLSIQKLVDRIDQLLGGENHGN